VGLKPADYATLAGGFLAALAVPAAVWGSLDLAVRLVFASYAFDVVDGWLARRYGSSEDGFFLDRAFDRLSQIVAPGVVLLSWARTVAPPEWYAAYSLYFAGLAVAAYYRLVRRGVRSLTHFNGLPLFAHAIVMLASYLAGWPPHPLLLLALLAASAAKIPYFRRPSRGSPASPSPAVVPRLAGLVALALIPYDNPLVEAAAKMIIVGVVVYAAVGPLPVLSRLPVASRLAGRVS